MRKVSNVGSAVTLETKNREPAVASVGRLWTVQLLSRPPAPDERLRGLSALSITGLFVTLSTVRAFSKRDLSLSTASPFSLRVVGAENSGFARDFAHFVG